MGVPLLYIHYNSDGNPQEISWGRYRTARRPLALAIHCVCVCVHLRITPDVPMRTPIWMNCSMTNMRRMPVTMYSTTSTRLA